MERDLKAGYRMQCHQFQLLKLIFLPPKKLQVNKDLAITHPGKVNGVVIMNRKDYRKAVNDILEDNGKFKKLKRDPTLLKEGQLQRFIRTLKKTRCL